MTFSRTARTVLALALFAIGLETHAASEWRTIASTVKHRSEGTLVTRGNSAWLFNGFTHGIRLQASVERYDVGSNRWTLLGSTSTSGARPTAVTHNGTVVVGDEVWLIGGRIGSHPGRVSDQVWIYDLDDGDWRRGPALPAPFAGGGAALVGNRIHLFGGVDARARCDVATHRVLDLSRQRDGWKTLGGTAAMPAARNHFSTAVVDGIIYAIGGQHGHDGCKTPAGLPQLKLVHAFDPATGRWRRRADLPVAQSHAEPSTFTHRGRIWMIGGKVQKHARKVWVYDPRANRWQERRDLELRRPLLAPGAAIFGNRLFLFGGGAPNVSNPTRDTQVITLPASDAQPSGTSSPAPGPFADPTSADAPDAWRINIGGPALTDASGRRWSGDTGAPHGAHERPASKTWTPAKRPNIARRGMASNVPTGMFATERSAQGGGRGLTWHFPVVPGRHEVRLYFAENWGGAFAKGRRVFDVLIEDALVADDVDVFAAAGRNGALMRSFVVSSDARLTIELRHVVQNPMLKGIEIVRLGDGGSNGGGAPSGDGGSSDGAGPGDGVDHSDDGSDGGGVGGGTGDANGDANGAPGGTANDAAPAELVESALDVDFGDVATGTRTTRSLRLDNAGGTSLRVTALALDGAAADAFTATLVGDPTIAPGDSRTVELVFRPLVEGGREAVLLVSHDGPAMLGLISLSGRASGGATTTSSGTRRVVHRLNVGGPALAGHDGIAWTGDLDDARAPFLTTPSRRFSTTRAVVPGTDAVRERVPAAVFATERFGTWRSRGLGWRFAVTPGRHEVRLHFAEIWDGAFADGRRTFDILVDGREVADGLDVFAESRGANRGLTRSFVVDDADGRLDIALRHVVQNPAVKGIEILECLDGCPSVSD